MDAWKNAPLTGTLTEIPGIGPAAAQVLADNGIYNTWMLFGKYLSMKGPADPPTVDEEAERKKKKQKLDLSALTPVGPQVHHDIFWYWLKDLGITAHRSAVVAAIGLKIAQSFPGVYDSSLYEEDDDE